MTNNEDGSFDFDPNVDYVAQVREEQGKLGGVVFEGGSTAPTPQIEVADPVYEQGVLDAVAESLDATAPTPEMIAEMKKQMAEIDQGLRGEDRISLYQMRAIADQIRAYSPQQQYEVAAAMREHKAVRNFWGDDHPKTLEAMDHANKVSMPREINKETVVTAEASTTNEKEGSGPTQGEVEDIEIIRQNLNAPVLGSLEEKSLSNPVDDRFASM
ncbi:MAG: hypothetical protein UY04_C0019G0008 [Parcubacteria group bacterium GW2011_GWA2_47_7]|nr:MAG: hypothetical protein UY04_C0019G0008 [Parcubacteria group bacterium GW2011_GWA2_47_7]